MSRADGVLVAPLKKVWFYMIDAGTKDHEYRKDGDGKETWARRLLTPDGLLVYRQDPMGLQLHHFAKYHTFRGSFGYSSRWTERKVMGIRWGLPRPEWSGDTVSGPCFIIELEPKHHGP